MMMQEQITPLENLLIVLDAVKQVGPDDIAQWFESSLDSYLASGGTFDERLGLKSTAAGQRSCRTRFLTMKRNRFLKQAHGLCSGSGPWSKSVQLEQEISRFESVIWPNVRNEESPPERLSDLRRALFNAFKVGQSIPATARQLHDIATFESVRAKLK